MPRSRSRDRDGDGLLASKGPLFAALGDETRLSLLTRLGSSGGGDALSITRLTEGTTLTRQAVTKHLALLEQVGLVEKQRRGRESRYRIQVKPLDEARAALERASLAWDQAIRRLKAFVEQPPKPPGSDA